MSAPWGAQFRRFLGAQRAHFGRSIAQRLRSARPRAVARRPPPVASASRASPQRSGAYRVFTRKRAILIKSSAKCLRTRLDGAGKGDFRPQQLAQRKIASSDLSTLHHPNHLEALSTTIYLAFPQLGRLFPALRTQLRRQHLKEGAQLQNDHVTHVEDIDKLPAVSSLCSWPTTATHAVTWSVLIGDWLMETSVVLTIGSVSLLIA